MRRLRNAKIVATLGPASTSAEVIGALFHAGVDVFRLNFSHGRHDDHRERIDIIRALEKRDRPADRHAWPICRARSCALGTFAEGQVDDRDRRAIPPRSRQRRRATRPRAPLPHPEIFAGDESPAPSC